MLLVALTMAFFCLFVSVCLVCLSHCAQIDHNDVTRMLNTGKFGQGKQQYLLLKASTGCYAGKNEKEFRQTHLSYLQDLGADHALAAKTTFGVVRYPVSHCCVVHLQFDALCKLLALR